jgi:nitroreductase
LKYDDFLNLVKKRRSVRKFKSDSIPNEYIEKILETVRWTPSGANTQPWELIVIKDIEVKNEFLNIVSERIEVESLRTAPILIVVCGDTRTRVLYPSGRNLPLVSNIGLEDHVELKDNILTSSLSNAFLYILLAATTLGLGTRYITSTAHPEVQTKIKQLLKIPPYIVIYDTVALGYSSSEPSRKMPTPLGDIVHYEHFDESKAVKLDTIIEKANALKKRLQSPVRTHN